MENLVAHKADSNSLIGLSRRAESITALDLFAGIGGFRAACSDEIGFAVEFVGSCEIDEPARRTYRAMFPGSEHELYFDDIRSIGVRSKAQSRRTTKRDRLRSIRESLPSVDLVTAGFPCQPHSLMGNRQGLMDDRGSLFHELAEVIEAVQPRHFVLENVRAIKSVNDGKLFKKIIRTLEIELGYNLRIWTLNAADYGVPQVRRRLFFVGSVDRLPDDPPPRACLERSQTPTVWHLLEREVAGKYYLSTRILQTILKDQHKGYSRKADINRLLARPLTRTMHKMHRASQDNYYSDAFIHGDYDAARNVVQLARCGRSRIRRITPKEAFRIQCFADALIQRALNSGVSDTQLYMQTGNAVPPLLARAVIRHAFGSNLEIAKRNRCKSSEPYIPSP